MEFSMKKIAIITVAFCATQISEASLLARFGGAIRQAAARSQVRRFATVEEVVKACAVTGKIAQKFYEEQTGKKPVPEEVLIRAGHQYRDFSRYFERTNIHPDLRYILLEQINYAIYHADKGQQRFNVDTIADKALRGLRAQFPGQEEKIVLADDAVKGLVMMSLRDNRDF